MLPPALLETVRGASSPATDRALPSRTLFSLSHISGRKGSAAGLRFNPVKVATACRRMPTPQRARKVLDSSRLSNARASPAADLGVLVAPRLQPATRMQVSVRAPLPRGRIGGTPDCLRP